ncbi:hypothetical protein ABZP36_000750 [Zizania latifolia]
MVLDSELVQVLVSGDAARLDELLVSREGRGGGDVDGRRYPQEDGLHQVSINVGDAAGLRAAAAARPGTRTSFLLGVTSNGNTALHLVASRGHVRLAELICELAPSLVATRNKCLDTPLHCAAKAGHRDVAAHLLRKMRAGGGVEEEAALRAENQLGATALYEAVRHNHTEVVDLFMAEAPELAAVTSGDGVSPLYLAAATGSVRMVAALLRPSRDGTPSPASFAGREGRTALHVAAVISKELAQEILDWEPEGPTLLTRVDSAGRSPLHFAVLDRKIDVIQLFLNAEPSIARISDDDGLFPLHAAAIVGSTRIIDELINRCPDYCELVDNKGRNFLHCAIEHNQDRVVRYVCRDGRFSILLNVMDSEGNTPLHLAVKCAFPMAVSLLLQTVSVDINIVNKAGLTAADLAHHALLPGKTYYFLDPHAIVLNCLCWVRAPFTIDGVPCHLYMDNKSSTKEVPMEQDDMKKNGTIASVLIATVAFAAAFTVPGGLVADDHPRAGTATLARRFAFRAFVVSDTMAFVFSIVATCFLIYAGATEIPLRHRHWYNLISSGLVPLGAQFMIAAFAFGYHLMLGTVNRGLVIFVYLVSSASVLFCFPGIWVPLHLGIGKAIWRRAGWRGLTNIYQHPCSLQHLFLCFTHSFLFTNIRRPVFAVLIPVTFVVAIALDVALPNY